MDKNYVIKRIIRVNHAGEYAAVQIYKGQLKALGDYHVQSDVIREMLEQEEKHLAFFTNELLNTDTRPTFFLPIWHALSFGMGYLSAKINPETAMCCTVAVEETIDEHYLKQIHFLEKEVTESTNNLLDNIIQFREEELEHRDIGLLNNANSAPHHKIIKKFVSAACKFGIFISKRI